jgi:type I restriction enzyme S subunit
LNITQREICIGRGLCALKPKYDIDIQYWFYVLSCYKDYFESQATGSTFKAISAEIIKNTIILLPPKEEQERILEKIIQINKGIED